MSNSVSQHHLCLPRSLHFPPNWISVCPLVLCSSNKSLPNSQSDTFKMCQICSKNFNGTLSHPEWESREKALHNQALHSLCYPFVLIALFQLPPLIYCSHTGLRNTQFVPVSGSFFAPALPSACTTSSLTFFKSLHKVIFLVRPSLTTLFEIATSSTLLFLALNFSIGWYDKLFIGFIYLYTVYSYCLLLNNKKAGIFVCLVTAVSLTHRRVLGS